MVTERDFDRDRLTSLIVERRNLLGRIGSGIIRPDSFDNRIRLGEVRGRILSSIERREARLTRIDHSLESERDSERLIQLAVGFRQERDLRSSQMRRIEELARQGLITNEELGQSKSDFEALLQRPQGDQDLKDGLRLLGERLKKELESAPKSKLSINLATRRVEITWVNGERYSFVAPHEGDFSVLCYLARRANTEVPASQLNSFVKRSRHFPGSASGGDSVRYLRSHLERDPKQPEVLVRVGQGITSAYLLRADATLSKKGGRSESSGNHSGNSFIEHEVHESRLLALETFINESQPKLSDLISILGKTRGEKPRDLTWNQAKSALKGATGKLYRRKLLGLATEQELKLWEKIKQSAGQQADLAVKNVTEAKIETWFRKQLNP